MTKIRLINIFKLCIILFISLSFVPSFADESTASISGLVVDKSNNEVITVAQIKIISKSGAVVKKTESDLSGKYSFTNLSEGEYTIEVTRLGYSITKIDVIVNAGEKRVFNIYLKPVDLEIERVNVTATKTEQTLQKTPSSLSVVTSDDIKSKNAQTFDQVLQDVQGVTINRTSGINVSALSIRGSSDVAGGGIGNRVLLLLDGRPSLTGDSKGALWSLIPVSIIEKTEVVKGAFSSLYGSSAIGGVINVITKKPTYKPFTSINLNAGFYEKLSDSLKFSNNLQMFRGLDILHSNSLNKISYLVDFNYKKNDGYSQQSDYQFYSGVAKMTYDLISNRDLEFTFQYTNSTSGYPHYWKKESGQFSQPYQVSDYYLGDKIDKETQSVDVFYRAIPGSKSKYTSRFYYYKLKSLSTYNPNNPVSLQYGTPGKSFETNISSYNFGNISQVDFEIGKSNYLISGLDLQWNVVKSSPESILYGDQQQNNMGVYVQDRINLITDTKQNTILSSTAGFRVDYNAFVGGANVFQISPKVSLLFAPKTTSRIFENTSYRFLVGRAFRSPSIAELYFKKELFGGFDFTYNPNLKPEEMMSFEVGLRKQYESRFTLDVSAYINTYNNLIQYVNIGTSIYGPFQVRNVAKSQIRGLDFSIDYMSKFRIAREYFGYKLAFNYSYIDAKDLSAGRTDDFLPYKPKHVFDGMLNLNYYGFNYNINGRYISKVDEVLFFKYEEPESYFLLDMKLSKEITKSVSAFFAVNNVFNKFYQELERIPAPNRNFNAGMNIEF